MTNSNKMATPFLDGDLQPIQDKAKELQVNVIIGVVEKDDSRGNALFCTAVYIDGKTGDIVNTHRKLMPTYDERKVRLRTDCTWHTLWMDGS